MNGGTEVRECVCGRDFEVVTEFAKPWTVCPDCMTVEPVDMSQVTLGPLYTSEDMYRGMGIERPTLPEGTARVDGIASVTIEIGEGDA